VVEGRRLGVEPICSVLQLAPSTYYAARDRAPSARAQRDAELIPRLVEIWKANYEVYGSRKLWKAARRGTGATEPPLRLRFSSQTGRPSWALTAQRASGGITGSIIAVMAMTLRLTDDEARALRVRAEREGRSMQEVARSAVREYIDRTSRSELLDAVLDDELPRYAEALRRLGQ
jgi:plasmid stability protein